jgi:hypothetical protein
MPQSAKISFFPCDNGDSVLMESDGTIIMTDINYRQSAQDDSEDEIQDFSPEIRNSCAEDRLNLFVLTHPDEDHCRGIDEIFHMGKPENWIQDPAEGDPKILIAEIWCSPYAANLKNSDIKDDAKPMIREIHRRKKLSSVVAGNKDGNRLVIMDTENSQSDEIGPFSWRLIAPTPEELDLANSEDQNPSSLGIVWTVKVNGYNSKESTPRGGGFGLTPRRGWFALPPKEARELSRYLSLNDVYLFLLVFFPCLPGALHT